MLGEKPPAKRDMLGLGNMPVQLDEAKVVLNQTVHPEITAQVWKKIPEWLDNPALVAKSTTVPGRYVITPLETVQGYPIRIIVEPKGGAVQVHTLMSALNWACLKAWPICWKRTEINVLVVVRLAVHHHVYFLGSKFVGAPIYSVFYGPKTFFCLQPAECATSNTYETLAQLQGQQSHMRWRSAAHRVGIE